MRYTDEMLAPYTLSDAKGWEPGKLGEVRFTERALKMMESTPLPKRHRKLASEWEGLPLPDDERVCQMRWLSLVNDALPDIWEVIALKHHDGLMSQDTALDLEIWTAFWRPTLAALPCDSFQEMLRNIGRAKLYDLSLSEPRPSVEEIAGWLGSAADPAGIERTYMAFNAFARVAPFLKEVEIPTKSEIACELPESEGCARRNMGQLALL